MCDILFWLINVTLLRLLDLSGRAAQCSALIHIFWIANNNSMYFWYSTMSYHCVRITMQEVGFMQLNWVFLNSCLIFRPWVSFFVTALQSPQSNFTLSDLHGLCRELWNTVPNNNYCVPNNNTCPCTDWKHEVWIHELLRSYPRD